MTTLRLGTYNLLDGGGGRLHEQVQMLAGLDLDILALQEAKHWDEDDFCRMWDTARALRMQPHFAPSASHGCHLVTLYRWPRVQPGAYTPDAAEGNFHHTVSRAQFQVDGYDLRVLNAHLAPFSGEDRLKEAGWLTEYGAPDQHTVLLGDLNTQGIIDDEIDDWDRLPAHLHSRHRLVLPDGSYGDSDRRAFGILAQAGFVDPPAHLQLSAPRTCGYWNPDELWDHRSDHALFSPSLAPALRTYHVEDTPAARRRSDHLPVIATLDLAS